MLLPSFFAFILIYFILCLSDAWKIPGGLVDDNEFISEAAEREVWEETGIKAKF